MSDYFNQKQYGEYFEKLNSRLESTPETPKAVSSYVKKPTPRRKGIYGVFRLNKRIILGLAAVILALVLILICSKGCENKPSKAVTEPAAEQQSVSETAETAESQDISALIVYEEDENTKKIPSSNDAKTGIVVRLSDRKIVAQRNSKKRIYPASTLKVMTLLTAADYIEDYSATFTMTLEITDPLFEQDASVAGFLNGEEVTMLDLFYGTVLPSGADAAIGLATKIAGSEEEFVKLMNQKAEQLGLTGSHFTNATGLYDPDNYSTAYDIAIILNHAYNNEICREVLSTYQHTTEKTPQNPDGITLSSTLFSYMYGTEPETATILGGKTGYVDEAGYCLASFGEGNDSKEAYIVVTMGNSGKWPAFYGQIALYKKFAK